MRDTDRDWTKIAGVDPYWGILSSEEFRGETLSEELKAKFYASGVEYVTALYADIRTYIPSFAPKRSLDFGCGVGRLLFPLAALCEEAVGVDIAPKMLDLAKLHAAEHQIGNVTFALGDDELSGVAGQFDFVHSFIVLQHIPPERGMPLLRKLLRLLAPGGVFALQLTFAKKRNLLMHEAPVASYYRRVGGVMHDLGALGGPAEGTVSMYDYDLNDIFALLSEFTGRPVAARPIPDDHLSLFMVGSIG